MFTTPEDHFLQEVKADTLYSTQKGLHLGNKRAQDALLGAKASSYCLIAQACTLATDRGLRKRCTLSITSSFDDSHSGSVSKRPCMARAAVRDAGLHQVLNQAAALHEQSRARTISTEQQLGRSSILCQASSSRIGDLQQGTRANMQRC